MKKALSTALILAFCIVCFAISVSAADAMITVETLSDDVTAGETVTMTVAISGNPGIVAVSIPIVYDESRLESPVYAGVGLDGWIIGTAAIWDAAEETTYNGSILTLTFTVKEDAPAGFAKVSVGPVKASNMEEEPVVITVADGGVTVKETVPGHDLVFHEARPATCSETGCKAYWECKECGKLFSDAEGEHEIEAPAVVDPIPHAWDEGVVAKEATCAEEGVKTYTCTVCGETKTEAIPVDPVAHKWGEWIQSQAPTYTQSGEEYQECMLCMKREFRPIPALKGTALDAATILRACVGLAPDKGYTPADAAAILGM